MRDLFPGTLFYLKKTSAKLLFLARGEIEALTEAM